MLENPRRSVILIGLLAIASIALLIWAKVGDKFNLGLDLRGGTALVYDVDFQAAKAEGLVSKDADDDQLLQETVDIIYRRIDPTGVLEATVTKRGNNGFLVELPGMSTAEALAVKQRIQNLGRLEMRVVATPTYEVKVNGEDVERQLDLAKEKQLLQDWLGKDDNKARVQADPSAINLYNNRARTGDNGSPHLAWYPALIKPKLNDPKRWDGGVGGADTVRLYEDADVMQPPKDKDAKLVQLVPINVEETYFQGSQLDASDVYAGQDPRSGKPCVYYAFQPKFETPYADWSEKWTGKASAIILNGVVESTPVFEGRIPGRGIITMGSGTLTHANELAKVLKTGSLQVRPELQSDTQIGSTLGEDAIRRGLISMALGATAVVAFMLWYYRLAGLVAIAALFLNVLLLVAAMVVIRATLTLPGIAGIVLTLGMAVDANILIYERIREEIGRGKDLLQAVRAGFDRALLTILDANITTFLAGLVLYNVGVGPVRGFAVTLMVGIATSVFTAYFGARLIFHYLLEWDKLKGFRVNSWFANVNFDWLRWSRTAAFASIVVMAGGLLHFFTAPREKVLGLDFTGGASLQVALKEPMTRDQIKSRLLANEEFGREFPDPQIITAGGTGADGQAKSFAVKLKLTPDELRQIGEQRQQAAQRGENFEPPYLKLFRTILADALVDSPFDSASVVPQPDSQNADGSLNLHFVEPVKIADVKSALEKRYRVSDVRVPSDTAAEAGSTVQVTFDVPKDTKEDNLFQLVIEPLKDLKTADDRPLELSRPFPEASEIGGRIVGEFKMAAIGAMILSWFLIAMYVRIRFHELKYGIAAVVALVHDVLITLGIVCLCNRLGLVNAEVDMGLIAALLTIIGYSINDTIVIFDRVRENLSDEARLGINESFRDLLNRSINQTFSRTILTTSHTLFVVLAQFLVNYGSGSSLEGFSFALLVGFTVGTYSTAFIATPIVLWAKSREKTPPPGSATAVEPVPQTA
ncbi:MAG: protein translocase subunit SecD [Planctomycetota bacterium]